MIDISVVPKLLQWARARWQFRHRSRVGARTRLIGRAHVVICRDAEVVIGERVLIMSNFARSVFAVFPGAKLEIGSRTYLNYGLDLAATELVAIGADCLIGNHVTITDNSFHELTERSRRPSGRPIVIEDGVWIGNRAVILPGVRIGAGAIVGAGSVVTHDVPPGTVVAGNPARIVRQLAQGENRPA